MDSSSAAKRPRALSSDSESLTHHARTRPKIQQAISDLKIGSPPVQADDDDADLELERNITTAFELKRAIEKCSYRGQLGKVVTVWNWELHPKPVQAKSNFLKKLEEVSGPTERAIRTYAFGNMESDKYHWKVTYPGCVYESEVIKDLESSTMSSWLSHAPVSGFGDNQTLETRIDTSVRMAAEIAKDYFEVDATLLHDIATVWATHFIPSRVRVEPYKIHLYGTGGHFTPHRDTPEPGLVGTFLLGLGDTTQLSLRSDSSADPGKGSGNFCIAGIKLTAFAGQWAAFHPDVPHSVSPLQSGQRAVMAFKIFSAPVANEKNGVESLYPELVQQTREVLDTAPLSFGIILHHKYPTGTTKHSLKGSDCVLYAAVEQLRSTSHSSGNPPYVQTHLELMPVIVRLRQTRRFDQKYFSAYEDEDEELSRASGDVFPFTRHDVALALGMLDLGKRKWTEAQVAWREGVRDLDFYCWDFETSSSARKWHEEYSEEINHTGNESDGTRDSSLYLAYAIVLVRKSAVRPEA